VQDAGGRTTIALTLHVRNRGATAVTLDREALRVEAFDGEATPLPTPRLIDSDDAALTVPAATTRDIDLVYAFPIALDPAMVDTVRLRWTMDGGRVQVAELRMHAQFAARSGSAGPRSSAQRCEVSIGHTSSSRRSGASSRSLTATRNDTASRPSTTRWS
jgi:hypothetical protein